MLNHASILSLSQGGGSFLSPTALISRVGGGRKPVRDYHTLKLVDPSSFRDILFEMPGTSVQSLCIFVSRSLLVVLLNFANVFACTFCIVLQCCGQRRSTKECLQNRPKEKCLCSTTA